LPGTRDQENILDFLKEAGRLKKLPRTGWTQSGVEDPESVADHTFRTTLISLIISDLQGLNSDKAVRMALLHDLAEIEVGDLTPNQKEGMEGDHILAEDRAMEDLLSILPDDIVEIYTETWKEYRRGDSPEARLVAGADRLEMLIQAQEYTEEGVDPPCLAHFWETEIKGGVVSDLAEALRKKRGI
jgi:putative hydrolase of HD superfamily